MDETNANLATVARLMTILGGETPIEAGQEFMAQDVVANFDGWRFQGINLWANWIRYLRTRRRVSELRLQVDRIVANPDGTITAFGRWHGLYRGREVVSNQGVATYRFQDGRIVEIWTTRTNYLLLFGPVIRYRWGLVLVFMHLWYWKRLPGELDLRYQAAVRPAL